MHGPQKTCVEPKDNSKQNIMFPKLNQYFVEI